MYLFDMNQVCTTKEAFEEHIAKGLSRLVQIPIDSVRPVVHVSAEERALGGDDGAASVRGAEHALQFEPAARRAARGA